MELTPGYKLTEVGVIPKDWSVFQLGALAEMSSGTTPARKLHERYYRNGSIAWVKTTDLTNADIPDTSEYVTELALRETVLRVYPVGTVLVAMYGGFQQIGRTGILRTPAAVNQAITAIQPKSEKLVSEYLLGTLNHRVAYWKTVASSSRKDPNISSQDIRNFPIALPKPSEQRAIAAALSDVDGLLGGLDRLIAKKRGLKQAAMQQLLTCQTRLPGFTPQASRFKQTDMGPIPEDWGISTVGQEFEVQLGKMLDVEKNTGVLKPYLGNRAVQWERIVIDEMPMMAMSRSDLERFRLQHGDLLVCEGGEVGRAAVWDSPLDECYFQKALHRLRPRHGFNPRLMIAFLRLWSERGQLMNYVTQTSIAHLPKDKFITVPLPTPSPDEQAAIAAVLSDMDAEIAALEQRREKTRALKQAMMQELLTGKTRLVAAGDSHARTTSP